MPSVSIPTAAYLIRNAEDVDHVLSKSAERLVLLFKHSTQCGTSMQALQELHDFMASPQYPAELEVAVVRVIEERPLSLLLAERLGVRHQSPQAILIRAGRAVWHASHYSITSGALLRAVQSQLVS